MSEDEANVIEVAQDLVAAWEGSKYGPMQHEVKRCEKVLVSAVADLQWHTLNDCRWRKPA